MAAEGYPSRKTATRKPENGYHEAGMWPLRPENGYQKPEKVQKIASKNAPLATCAELLPEYTDTCGMPHDTVNRGVIVPKVPHAQYAPAWPHSHRG